MNKLAKYCFVLFWGLVAFAKLFQIGFIFYPAILLGMIGLLIGDDTYRIGFCLMLVPNIRMFDGLGTTFIVNIMLGTPILAKVVLDRRINPIALAHTMVIAIMEFAHIVFLRNYGMIIPNMAAIAMLFYVESVLLDRKVKINLPEVVRRFAFGSVFSAAVYLMVYWRVEDLTKYLKGYRFEGYASDPNYYSLYICLAIALIFILKQHKTRDYVYIGVLMAIELFTLSKMAMVILIIIIMYVAGKAVLSGFSYRTRFIRRFLLVAIGATALFSGQIVNMISQTFVRLFDRDSNNLDIDSITTLRFSLLSFYGEQILNNPVLLAFGYGMQYNDVFEKNVSHNTFFDILLTWGIAGVLVFVFIFFTLIRRLMSNCPEKITTDHFFPLFVLMLTFLSLSCLSASMFWWVICAALLPLKGIVYEDRRTAVVGDSTGFQRTKLRIRMRRVAH